MLCVGFQNYKNELLFFHWGELVTLKTVLRRKIAQIMQKMAKEYSIEFLYRDFREGWREGQDEARAAGLYMQKYCGCVYSEEESGLGREIAKQLKKQGISPTNANVRKIIEERKEGNIINPSKLKEQL